MDHRLNSGGDAFMSDLSVRAEPKVIPAEIKCWNWGAFLLNWIWGIGNNTYIALLALIPFVSFIMLFVLGAKGSAWAWRNGRWDSVEHFKRVQRRWAIWGLVIWIAVPTLFGVSIGGIFFGLKHSAAYEMAVAKLQANPLAVNILRQPNLDRHAIRRNILQRFVRNGRAFFFGDRPKSSRRCFCGSGQERRSLVDQEAHAQTQRQRQGDRSHQQFDAEHDVMPGQAARMSERDMRVPL
jgi:hypothetical protein